MKNNPLRWLYSSFLHYYLLFLLVLILLLAGADRLFWQFYQAEPLLTLQETIALTEADDKVVHLELAQIALPEHLRARLLARGWLRVSDAEQGDYYYQLQPQQQLIVIGPLPPATDSPWLLPALFYGLLAMVLFLLLYPLFRDLQRLRNSAAQFARTPDPQWFQFPHGFYLKGVVATLQNMSGRLTELLQLTREVSDTLSHELRTPLARLRFSLATLPEQPDTEALRQAMADDLEELDLLVDEYLQYARESYHSQHMQWCSAGTLLSPLIARFEQFGRCTIVADYDAELLLWVEPRLFARVVNNLLGNGCKYAREHLLLRLSYAEGYWTLDVEDDGQGFVDAAAADEMARLFQPFAQHRQAKPGYGLGLAIVRKAMECHQGEVVLGESQQLAGAKVQVRWPSPHLGDGVA